jgi:competence ComEA-like helix-hairpin-helix protein
VLWATQGLYAKKKPPAHPVNLNTATAEELQQVPGIGPATAEKILQARKSYGRFKSVNDLEAIRGIGPKKLEKMRKYLTVGTPDPQNKKSMVHATPSSKPPPAKKPEAEKQGRSLRLPKRARKRSLRLFKKEAN